VLIYVTVGFFTVVLLGYWAATASMYQQQKRMVAAIRTAERVTLEEYRGDEVLTLREIPQRAREGVVAAVPYYVIFPLSLKLCFKPHHRIAAVTPNVSTNTLLICFLCDQGRYDDGAIFDMPREWTRNLRGLLETNGVPVRDEY
jgi:hypothetical protein